MRDLDRALKPLRHQAQTLEKIPDSSQYFEHEGSIYRNAQSNDGLVPVPLCNFSARIIDEVVHDDGVEQTRRLTLQGRLSSGQLLPPVEVPAIDFAGMGWIVPAWGTRAVVYAGMGTKDHVRTAVQLLSGDVPRRTVYQHTGWRKIRDEWFYLHSGGAIGTSGHADLPVLLPEALAGFQLPPPPVKDEQIDAVKASLRMLSVGPDRVTFPLIAAVYRSALGNIDFALHLVGPTGCYKSEAAALAQQHFGAGVHSRCLPANWSSTGNALEGLAFAAKDTLLVVDDFCPTGSAIDIQRYHKEADRLFRGQGNGAGRQRMRPDGTLRPAKYPRGLILSTGEDTPRGPSLRARLMVLDISPGDLGPQPPNPNPILSACQKDAADGKYAASMAGFLCWLAPQLDSIRSRLRIELSQLRDMATAGGQHARTPGIIADLGLGLRYFLKYAVAVGAISQKEFTELWDRGWQALKDAGSAQADQIAAGEPAATFLRLLFSALISGYAHVTDKDGNEPDSQPQAWGWRGRLLCRKGGRKRHSLQAARCWRWLARRQRTLS